MSIERDPHAGPVPDAAWHLDAETRADAGRTQIFNATRPGGMDGWTMDLSQYETVRDVILDVLDSDADDEGTVTLRRRGRRGPCAPRAPRVIPQRSAHQLRPLHQDRHGSPLRDRTSARLEAATHQPLAQCVVDGWAPPPSSRAVRVMPRKSDLRAAINLGCQRSRTVSRGMPHT